MNTLSRDELKTLVKQSTGLCISMFLPTHQAGAEAQQDPIRFKNLLRAAEEHLLAHDMRATEVQDVLEPVQKLLDDGLFLQQQDGGLAIFRAPEVLRYYRLPLGFDELLVVADRFHIKPLLPLLAGDGQFYVLALSQKQVRLLQGTRNSIGEVALHAMPTSLAEALKYDDFEKQSEFRVSSSGGTGARPAVHGHSFGKEDAKENIRQFFFQVDKGLHDLLHNERAPLVLAGVDYLLPMYKEVNTYPHLTDAGIVGNPAELRADDLHAQAWAIVQPYFLKAQHDAAEHYKQVVGTGLASKDVKEVVPAAYYGRVDVVFVAVDQQQWGSFDPDSNAVHMHQQAEPGDEDLLDFAAMHTILNSGTVYAVAPEQLPDDGPLAALFRY